MRKQEAIRLAKDFRLGNRNRKANLIRKYNIKQATSPNTGRVKMGIRIDVENNPRDYIAALDDDDKLIFFSGNPIKRIPAIELWDTPKARKESINEQHEITVGGYTTTHFYMCGSAQEVMKQNADVLGAEELTKLQDMFYKLEKDVLDAGTATDEQKNNAQRLHDEIMRKAEIAGLSDKIGGYMKQHLDSVIKGDPKPGFGRTDLNESVSEAVKVKNAPTSFSPAKYYFSLFPNRQAAVKKLKAAGFDGFGDLTVSQKDSTIKVNPNATKFKKAGIRLTDYKRQHKYVMDIIDEATNSIQEKKIAGLVKKAEKSGMPYGILKQVYNRGMAAWKTGHRPGTTPQQWAFARVNSFVTKSSGTWGKADKDLAAKVRARKK